jgi:hypothetical protein
MGRFSFVRMLLAPVIGSAERQSICFQKSLCFTTGISKPSFMKTEPLARL